MRVRYIEGVVGGGDGGTFSCEMLLSFLSSFLSRVLSFFVFGAKRRERGGNKQHFFV
jgi:hypothetical protein